MTNEPQNDASGHGGAESRALTMLRDVVIAGRPLIYVHSTEEQRLGQLLRDAARRFFSPPIPVWTWSLTEGMRRDDDTMADALAPRAALDFIASHPPGAIFHLKDFHEPMRDSAEIRRRLRDLYGVCLDADKFVVISSPIRFIPDELARDLVYIELGVPDRSELEAFLRHEGARIAAAGGTVELDDEGTLHQLAQALRGLTLDEAGHAVRRAVAGQKPLGPASVPMLLEEKRLLVNRSGLVEYIADGTAIEHVGGLELLKKWLLERRTLFAMRDTINADIVPKGVLIMGISGCGKSLSIKAIASYFGLPLYRINMTDIFSGVHGAAEAAFMRACRMVEEIAPAVVWFDEIEMGVTSQESAGEQGRMFAFFLTWMQEKARGVFVAATANRIDLLPAEMIRKGRFDEVFFVDLPGDDERVAILKIHLERRGIDTAGMSLEQHKRFTQGWTGAEIEQCVVSALSAARLQNRDLTDDDLRQATLAVVPLSKTMREQVEQIRSWAYARAVRASPRAL